MFCPFHSNIRKNSIKNISAIHPAITENTENILVKRMPHFSMRESSISAMSNLFHKQGIVWGVPQQSVCLALKPLRVYRKLSPLRSCEERMGDQRGTKVAPWCKHCSCCGWWIGTSQDKATLISEEIKSLALAVLELCLSEGISK